MAFYNKLVLTNIGESTLTEVLSSGRNLLLSELRLSADVYNQTEIKNLVSLSNTANIIATSSVILEEETGNFIISGSFSNKDITESLTINSIGLYSTLDNKIKLIGVATAIEPIIIKPFQNAVNFYNLKLSLALKQSEYNAIVIIDDLKSDRVVLRNLVTNGDFINGFDGWTVLGDVQNIDGRAKLVRPTGGPLASLTYRDRAIFSNRNDVYYISVQGELVNWASGSGGVMINDTTNIIPMWTLSSRPSGVVSNSSRIFNLSLNNTPHLYANTVVGSEYFIDHIIIVNLTQTFGAGNEPSKEWMDSLISQTGYFEEYILDERWQFGEMLRLDDTKANKVQEDWITPTLLNGWYAIRANEPPQYMKDEFGFVHFRGCVSKGASATSNVAFQLPTGYRPNVNTSFGMPAIGPSGMSLAVSISVGGNVDFAGAPSNTWYGISYITFKAV